MRAYRPREAVNAFARPAGSWRREVAGYGGWVYNTRMVLEAFLGGLSAALGRTADLLAPVSMLRDIRAEKKRVAAEITKAHGELWRHIRSLPEAEALFDRGRDASRRPPTPNETHCVRLVLAHFSWAHSEHRAGRYDLPEEIGADLRCFLSPPVPQAVWRELRPYQDRDVREFIDAALGVAS